MDTIHGRRSECRRPREARRRRLGAVAAIALTVVAAACDGSGAAPTAATPSAPSAQPSALGGTSFAPGRLDVVATTTLVGDIVARVGGENIALTVLLPFGADPHGFEPSPRDVAGLADADLVFANGLGLEAFLTPLTENVGADVPFVIVSDGIEALTLSQEDDASDHGSGNVEGDHDLRAGDQDPHVWFDPANVAIWAHNIAAALSTRDAHNAPQYAANAEAVIGELRALDAWIVDEVTTIPEANRRIVTDHVTLGYFARRYGFVQEGTLHGFSPLAESSAAELAALEDTVVALGVPAVFVGTTVNPSLAQRLADDTGAKLVRVYTGSLSEPGGPADNYEAFMRYDVKAIVEALR